MHVISPEVALGTTCRAILIRQPYREAHNTRQLGLGNPPGTSQAYGRHRVTIAVRIVVSEGAILAADSASTLVVFGPDGQTSVANVYNNANKVFNLYKGLPTGAVTWGAGNIGAHAISTLAKDFRSVITAGDADQRVDCTIGFQRFMPGPDTVGGPVEVAAITKHEGFKWIARKHYFSIGLNSGKEEWLRSAVSPRAEVQDRCVQEKRATR